MIPLKSQDARADSQVLNMPWSPPLKEVTGHLRPATRTMSVLLFHRLPFIMVCGLCVSNGAGWMGSSWMTDVLVCVSCRMLLPLPEIASSIGGAAF